MKFLLLFALLGLQVHATVFSQSKITLNLPQATLGTAFKSIEEKSQYRFVYNNEVVPFNKTVKLNVKNETIENVLKVLLSEFNLDFQIMKNGVIVISEKRQRSSSKNFSLSGKVTDGTGLFLPGATVVLQGPYDATAVSDTKGRFSFTDLPAGSYTLNVSFIGYEDQSSKIDIVKDVSDYVIALKGSNNSLNEVMVVGYGKETRRNSLGANTKVTAQEISRQPVGNALSALQGIVPGLEVVNSSGTPGTGVTIRIRGINSVGAGGNVLILIDGVQGDISTIPPSDIESIDVLKDASSTAIYGARGANGVILVTTKKGSSNGDARISLNAYNSFSKPTNLPGVLNTQQYRQIRKEAFAYSNVVPTAANAPDLFMDSTVNTNWGKTLYNNALTQDYQLSASGGNQKAAYYFSAGYRNEDATLTGDWFSRRANVRLGIDSKISPRLTIGGAIAYNDSKSHLYSSPIASTIYYALPMLPFNNALGSASLTAFGSSIINPNRQLTIYSDGEGGQLIGNAFFNYKILGPLSFRTDASYQVTNGKGSVFNPSTSYAIAGTNNSGTYSYSGGKMFTVEPQLNFEHRFSDHYLKLLAGATLLNRSTYGTSLITATAANAIDDLNTLATGTLSSKSYSETPYKFASTFARGNYSFKNRYLIEALIRRDGSSRFGADNKYGIFYAVGAGWIFSDEPFLKNGSGSFFGKLRANYGVTGNDNIGDFAYVANSISTTNLYNGNNTIFVNNLANPSLKWEETSKFDVGLDLNFFKGRVSATVDYYYNKTKGTLFGQSLSLVTGFNSITSNLDGEVENKGLELALNIVPFNNGSFKWTSGFTLTTVKNKLLALPGLSTSSIANRYTFRVGEPLALIWGFKYLGVDPATGIAKFEDVNNNGAISANTDDTQIIGKSIPDYYGAWTNTLNYKRFDLVFQTQFVQGIDKGYNVYSSLGNTFNLPVSVLDRWRKPGDVTNVPASALPGTAAYNTNSLISSSDFAYSDASYLRLKNLTLGYTFKTPEKMHISNLRAYVTGYNLLTITNFKGDDPEGSNNFVPISRVITAGISVTF